MTRMTKLAGIGFLAFLPGIATNASVVASACADPIVSSSMHPAQRLDAAAMAEEEALPTLNSAPMLRSISLSRGFRSQTLTITLRGKGFVGAGTVISFGDGISITSLSGNDTTLIARIMIEAGAKLGLRSVTVVNPSPSVGTSTLSDAFEVVNPVPEIRTIFPDADARGKSVSVTITGMNFVSGMTAVSMGTEIFIDSVVVVNSTKLTARTLIFLDAATGQRDVTVSNPSPGGGSSVLSGGFSVQNPVPTVLGVSPSKGSTGQILNIVLSGSDFLSDVSSLDFGPGISVNALAVDTNGTRLFANLTVASWATVGIRNITVTNAAPGGGSSTLPNAFSVQNPTPLVAAVSPGTTVRGQSISVKLSGSNFLDGLTSVEFGAGIKVKSMVVTSSTELLASLLVSTESVLGAHDVVAKNPAPGGGTAILSGAFNVANPAPTISSIVPSSASNGSVLDVVIAGAQFIEGVTSFNLGPNIGVSNLVMTSPTQARATITITPSAAVGTRNVTVTNASPGGGSASITNGFTITSSLATGIEGYLGDVPDQFVLQEAYPNPFNPSTRIRFGIPEDSRIKLEVYNMLGNIVAELIDGTRSKGSYELQWHADNLPSGVYLVRLHAESIESTKRFIGSRKVVLVK